MSSRLPILFVLFCAVVCRPGNAQSSPDPSSSSTPPDTSSSAPEPSEASTSERGQPLSADRLSLWIGGSLSTGDLIGNIPRGQFGLLGLRYHRSLSPSTSGRSPDRPTLTYTADLFPVLFLSIPPGTIPAPKGNGDQGDESEPSTRKQGLDTFGFGASPVGFRINYRSGQRIQPYIAGSIGFVYFLRSMPDQRGKHLNFTADAGVGVQVALTADVTLTAGYRYQHLSNGFRGKINPGVDANLLHLGITVPR